MNHIEYTVRVYDTGTKEWFLNGELHREDGPASESSNGNKYWWLNGKRHRENGPAVEYISGYKAWWLNNQLHREDGPAIERADGTKTWHLNGKQLTEEEFNQKQQSCNGKVVEIGGKKYKLEEV